MCKLLKPQVSALPQIQVARSRAGDNQFCICRANAKNGLGEAEAPEFSTFLHVGPTLVALPEINVVHATCHEGIPWKMKRKQLTRAGEITFGLDVVARRVLNTCARGRTLT